MEQEDKPMNEKITILEQAFLLLKSELSEFNNKTVYSIQNCYEYHEELAQENNRVNLFPEQVYKLYIEVLHFCKDLPVNKRRELDVLDGDKSGLFSFSELLEKIVSANQLLDFFYLCFFDFKQSLYEVALTYHRNLDSITPKESIFFRTQMPKMEEFIAAFPRVPPRYYRTQNNNPHRIGCRIYNASSRQSVVSRASQASQTEPIVLPRNPPTVEVSIQAPVVEVENVPQQAIQSEPSGSGQSVSVERPIGSQAQARETQAMNVDPSSSLQLPVDEPAIENAMGDNDDDAASFNLDNYIDDMWISSDISNDLYSTGSPFLGQPSFPDDNQICFILNEDNQIMENNLANQVSFPANISVKQENEHVDGLNEIGEVSGNILENQEFQQSIQGGNDFNFVEQIGKTTEGGETNVTTLRTQTAGQLSVSSSIQERRIGSSAMRKTSLEASSGLIAPFIEMPDASTMGTSSGLNVSSVSLPKESVMGKSSGPNASAIAMLSPGAMGTSSGSNASAISMLSPGAMGTSSGSNESAIAMLSPGAMGTSSGSNASAVAMLSPGAMGTSSGSNASAISMLSPGAMGTSSGLNASAISMLSPGAMGTSSGLNASAISMLSPGAMGTSSGSNASAIAIPILSAMGTPSGSNAPLIAIPGARALGTSLGSKSSISIPIFGAVGISSGSSASSIAISKPSTMETSSGSNASSISIHGASAMETVSSGTSSSPNVSSSAIPLPITMGATGGSNAPSIAIARASYLNTPALSIPIQAVITRAPSVPNVRQVLPVNRGNTSTATSTRPQFWLLPQGSAPRVVGMVSGSNSPTATNLSPNIKILKYGHSSVGSRGTLTIQDGVMLLNSENTSMFVQHRTIQSTSSVSQQPAHQSTSLFPQQQIIQSTLSVNQQAGLRSTSLSSQQPTFKRTPLSVEQSALQSTSSSTPQLAFQSSSLFDQKPYFQNASAFLQQLARQSASSPSTQLPALQSTPLFAPQQAFQSTSMAAQSSAMESTAFSINPIQPGMSPFCNVQSTLNTPVISPCQSLGGSPEESLISELQYDAFLAGKSPSLYATLQTINEQNTLSATTSEQSQAALPNLVQPMPIDLTQKAGLIETSANPIVLDTDLAAKELKQKKRRTSKARTNSGQSILAKTPKRERSSSQHGSKVMQESVEKAYTHSAKRSKVDTQSVKQGKVDTQSMKQGKVDTQSMKQGKVDTQSVKQGKVDTQLMKQSKVDTQSVKQGKVDTQLVKQGKVDTQSVKQSKVDTQSMKQSQVLPKVIPQVKAFPLISSQIMQSKQSLLAGNQPKKALPEPKPKPKPIENPPSVQNLPQPRPQPRPPSPRRLTAREKEILEVNKLRQQIKGAKKVKDNRLSKIPANPKW